MSYNGRKLSLMKTYSHKFKILIEFLGNFIRKFAASYRSATFRTVQGRNLPSWSARDAKNRLNDLHLS